MSVHKLCFLAFSLTAVSSQAASSLSYELDPAKTTVQFTLHSVLHTVHGKFKLKRGSISFDPDSGAAMGEIVIDVAGAGEFGAAWTNINVCALGRRQSRLG